MILQSQFEGTAEDLIDQICRSGLRLLAYEEMEPGFWIYSAMGPLPKGLDEVTLTFDREGETVFVCLVRDNGAWKIREARSEDGDLVFVTLDEFKALRRRAEAGENEAGL